MMIKTPRFERLWKDSNIESREEVSKYILLHNKMAIRRWIHNHPSLELGERCIRDLRDMASRQRVPNYSRMMKHELIRELSKCKGK